MTPPNKTLVCPDKLSSARAATGSLRSTEFVRNRRLLDRKPTPISAQARAGKTTLQAQWLDEHDNALDLFVSYLIGAVDQIIMRLVDFPYAFPVLVLAIAAVAIVGPNLTKLMIVLGCVSWIGYARLVRGLVLSLRDALDRRFFDWDCLGGFDAAVEFKGGPR